ncbi:hypothetical protein B0T22DRAFT_455576 [Podospora appendiculata]|uniref:Uncharacterized protein n=1 Tax=Podospora appendiculata TaxID=314037 RepID=A0AAE0XLD5_9PEZI|nr:hypothetical protein B0T22DRAFT_455576 [Podospora appendiculata]
MSGSSGRRCKLVLGGLDLPVWAFLVSASRRPTYRLWYTQPPPHHGYDGRCRARTQFISALLPCRPLPPLPMHRHITAAQTDLSVLWVRLVSAAATTLVPNGSHHLLHSKLS